MKNWSGSPTGLFPVSASTIRPCLAGEQGLGLEETMNQKEKTNGQLDS